MLVKRKNAKGFRLHYDAIGDYLGADDKTAFLEHPLNERRMSIIQPNAQHAWLDQPAEETSGMLVLADRKTKASASSSRDRAVFKLYSLGVSTNRDEWLYDRSKAALGLKAQFLNTAYSDVSARSDVYPDIIKWSRNLKRRLAQGRRETFDPGKLVRASYRPFSPRWLYQSELFIDEPGLAESFFPEGAANTAICFSDIGARTDYCVLAVNGIADLHFGAAVDAYQQVARYRYTKSGERVDNITDWAQNRFVGHYGKKAGISKDAIFHYVYAVLNDSDYREKYALNLKREFPRVPFYPDFARWAAWGKQLMTMHIGYEDVEPWPIERVDTPNAKRAEGTHPKPMLTSMPEQGLVRVDEDTQITGIPCEAWRYRLGNRSAIDWVLDQHKEKAPRDPTIREKFNTYRFVDYKEDMIALLAKIVRVSVDTVAVTDAMQALDRSDWSETQ